MIVALLTLIFLSTTLAQGKYQVLRANPAQKWEYLMYVEREDDQTPPIYVGYRHAGETYTLDDFAKAIGSKEFGGVYLNFGTDVLNYFGLQGWEMTGVYHELAEQGGPRLIMYFKRPLK